MKKRIIEVIFVFFVILGFNLVFQNEVFAGQKILEPGTYDNQKETIYYALDFWDKDNNKTIEYYKAEIYITDIEPKSYHESGRVKTATMKFYTIGANAIAIEKNLRSVRGPADATPEAKKIADMNSAVKNAMENENFAGTIDKDDNNYDEVHRAVFPGKTYMLDLFLPEGINNNREECYLDPTVGGKALTKEGSKYKMTVPNTNFADNFEGNKVRVKAEGMYHEYKASWEVEIEYKDIDGYKLKKKFRTDRDETDEKIVDGKTLEEKFPEVKSNTYIYIYDANDTRDAKNKKLKINNADSHDIKIRKKTITSFNLLADVTVNQWIQSVTDRTDGTYSAEDYLQYVDTEGKMNIDNTNGRNEKGKRRGWTELGKTNEKVLVENGQYLKYKVRLKNNNTDAPVYVRLQTEMTGITDIHRISWENSNGDEGSHSFKDENNPNTNVVGNANINTGHYPKNKANGEQKSVGWYYLDTDTKTVKGKDNEYEGDYSGGDKKHQEGGNYEGYDYEFIEVPQGGWVEFTITARVTASQAEWNTKENEEFQELLKSILPPGKEVTDVGKMYNYEDTLANPNANDMAVTTSTIYCTYVAYEKKNLPGEDDGKAVNLAHNVTEKKKEGDNTESLQKTEDGSLIRPDQKKDIDNRSATTSRDTIVLKQYDVSINTFIKKVERSDKSNTLQGEYLVEDNNYLPGANRREQSAGNRKANPVYVENGDIVTIRVILKNNSASKDQYYWNTKTLKQVSVPFKLNVDTKAQVEEYKIANPEEVPGVSCSLKNNKEDPRLVVQNVPNKATIKIDIKLKINTDTENAIGWNNTEARSVTSNIGYEKGKGEKNKNLPNGVCITNYYNYKNCFNTAWWRDYKKLKEEGKFVAKDWFSNYYNYDGMQLLETITADYFQVKDYNVVVDKYIQKVNHQESQGGTKVTYEADSRKSNITVNNGTGTQDALKTTKPVSVEYGDRVTYKLRIYNTTKADEYNIGKRDDAPYKEPQYIYVNMTDTLPNKYSGLTITGVDASNYKVNEGKIEFTDVKVDKNTCKEITVSLIVEEPQKNTIETNTVKINRIGNINKYVVINHGKRETDLDKYQLNDYNARLDEYISVYNAEMAKYNNAHGFTTGESEGFSNSTQNYPSNVPLKLEKYETLTYVAKVTNEAKSDEVEDSKASYNKYNTRVRPTDVTNVLDDGLEKTGFTAKWYKNNGTVEDITEYIAVKDTKDGTKTSYQYTIKPEAERIILEPGEYILYITNVTVRESNLCLQDLRSHSSITTLTNVNRNESHTREVTEQNICNKKADEDWVSLKELVIAGNVWVDKNKDGYQNDTQEKNDVVVKLYRVTNQDKNEAQKVAETTTKTATDGRNGFYTFERQDRADANGNYYKYYVEFEYDGVFYKATEVYGGDNDGDADGMQNLGGKDGSITWLRGYNGLPLTISMDSSGSLGSGNMLYMTDSNAYEFDDTRNNFNQKYTAIGFNKAYSTFEDNKLSTAGSIDLEYTKSPHTSTLDENATGERVMRARSFITQNYKLDGEGVQEKLSNTNTLYLSDYKSYHNEQPETEYLKFINLGLVPREEVDISLDADVKSVKTTINGEEMTYEFDKNSVKSDADDYGIGNEKNYYKLDEAYQLLLDKSDYNYRYDDYYDDEDIKDYKGEESGEKKTSSEYEQAVNKTENDLNPNGQSELTAEVTYTVDIRNKQIVNDEPQWENVDNGSELQDTDIPVEVAINEMAIYYDANFVKKGTKDTTTVKDKNTDKNGETDTGTGLLEDFKNLSIRVKYGDQEASFNIYDKIREQSAYSPNQPKHPQSPNDDSTEGYNVLYLSDIKDENNNPIYIKEGDSKQLEITFTVDKAKIGDLERALKIFSGNEMGLEMITEITSYTTRYGENYKHKAFAGKIAGLIDRDSNPGNLGQVNGNSKNNDNNATRSNAEFYEDDTYRVGVKVLLEDEDNPNNSNAPITRKVTGMVWDDARSEKIEENRKSVQYLGNGEYKVDFNDLGNPGKTDKNDEKASKNPNDDKDYDKPVPGVKVTLIEVVQTKDGYYEQPARYTYDTGSAEKGDVIECITNENGEYTLDHFIPGYYKVRFDYGWRAEKDSEPDKDSILYNGQDYKSTTYYNKGEADLLYYNTEKGYNANDYIGNEDKKNFEYFDKVKEALEVKSKSDAQDDEIRRLNVNAYSETMTALQATVFAETSVTGKNEAGYSDYEEYKKANDKILIDNTHMYAESTIFYVKPEAVKSEIEDIDTGMNNFNQNRLWNIQNLDFGLEYRPEASILLDKDISTVKLVTSDNETLIKLCFKMENGKRVIDEAKSVGYDKVQYMPNKEKETQGFVYINMDTKILEGCTFEVEYAMTTQNDSEVDRINKNLNRIKFEKGAKEESYSNRVYARSNVGKTEENASKATIEYTYNANATAAELLAKKYYQKEKYVEKDRLKQNIGMQKWLNHIKKAYKSDGTTEFEGVELAGQEYYGMYQGETYYTGKIGKNDIVAELKVDHILDYVDNDLAFNTSQNNTKNRLWAATTSNELYSKNMLNWNKVNKVGNRPNYFLIDKFGIKYDTENRSNLALSVDDNKDGRNWEIDDNDNESYGENNINTLLSKFLIPTGKDETKSTGKINIVASKVLSAEDISGNTGLSYENLSEVLQYTTLTGRRTKLPKDEGGGVIGNASTNENWTGYENWEDDTDGTEIISISPPTGLTE